MKLMDTWGEAVKGDLLLTNSGRLFYITIADKFENRINIMLTNQDGEAVSAEFLVDDKAAIDGEPVRVCNKLLDSFFTKLQAGKF